MKDEWKTFESFCQFSSGFLIFICPATKKNAFVIFLYLCHTWITGTFGQLTFLWFDFYEQWLKNPYLCFLGQRLLKFWVCFQFQEWIMHRMLFFEYFFLFPAIFDVLYFAMERLTLLHFMLLFLFEIWGPNNTGIIETRLN